MNWSAVFRRAVRARILPLGCAVVLAVVLAAGPTGATAAPPTPGAPPAPAAPAPDPTALFNNAVASFDQGDYQTAINNIQTLFSQIPADLPPADKTKLAAQLEPLYFTLGAAYFNLKDFAKTSEALKDYLTRYPRGTRVAEARFALAQSDYINKDYPPAAAGFAALETEPAYREQALLFEGLSFKEGGDADKAIVPLEKLIAGGLRSPTVARGAMALVSLYAGKSRPDKALKLLSDLQANIAQVENIVELNAIALAQGDAYLEAGSGKEALVCYRVVRTRNEVIALQRDRVVGLQRRLEANKAAMRANPKQAAQYLLANKQLQDAIADNQALSLTFQKLPSFRPKLLYRIGRAFALLDKPWESLVAYSDIVDASKDPADREPAIFGLVMASADVGQASDARAACNQYLQEFPQGPNAFTVGYMLGATALQENDPKAAEGYFGRMLSEQPSSPLAGDMRFLLGNARFAQGKYDEAVAEYRRYGQDFATGPHAEECRYRIALGTLFQGKYEEALGLVEDYLKANPNGKFVIDAKYRREVCRYAMSKYDEVMAGCQDWVRQYPGDQQQGEVLSLLGDAFAATNKPDDALGAYRRAFKAATTDEVLNYALLEAGKILQKRGQWHEIGEMFEGFVRDHPEHPTVPTAMSWIARAKTKEGKVDEAKHFLADNVKKYIHDSHREAVEGLLDQLAALCVRKRPPATPPASPAPGASPVADANAVATAIPVASPAADPGAELDALLGDAEHDQSPTARARILYAKAQLARLRRQDAEADRNLLEIGRGFKPVELSPILLGQVGDALLAKGKLDEAAPFYQELMDIFPKSDYVDFAYNGLGEISFQKKQYDAALGYFNDGTDKIAANLKLKELTLGRAKTFLALGKYDESKKLFEQVATTREWRGEATAASVYSLGEIEAKQGRWAEANAYYQRVYVAYQRFLPWVAKAYLGSAESLEKLGKKQDAVNTYKDMLRNQKLAELPESAEARQRLQALGAG